MASATGVVKEIAMAKKNNVPIFGVYVDGAESSSNLPGGLASNRTISWTWDAIAAAVTQMRSEEHTSELQSLMRNSYAVFCLKKKKRTVTLYTDCGRDPREDQNN